MPHAPKSKNISDYNTFHVFDEIYGTAKPLHFGELDKPPKNIYGSSALAWLLLLIFIFTLGASLHPLASYFLKTPYPLVAVGGDSMSPTLQKNDLVLVEGLPNLALLQPEDVIVYLADESHEIFAIERVKFIAGEQSVWKHMGSSVLGYFGSLVGKELPAPTFGGLSGSIPQNYADARIDEMGRDPWVTKSSRTSGPFGEGSTEAPSGD